jgi:hypothetical protein
LYQTALKEILLVKACLGVSSRHHGNIQWNWYYTDIHLAHKWMNSAPKLKRTRESTIQRKPCSSLTKCVSGFKQPQETQQEHRFQARIRFTHTHTRINSDEHGASYFTSFPT